MAHEINNPMGFIMSNLNSLKKYMMKIPEFITIQSEAIGELSRENGSGEAVRRRTAEAGRSLKIDYILEDTQSLIKESLDGAERVKVIVQDLKNFSRADEAEYKLADINRILESIFNIVWNELKYKATVKKEYGRIPSVWCNAGQLGQVFMNILVNAAQAMPDHGGIPHQVMGRERIRSCGRIGHGQRHPGKPIAENIRAFLYHEGGRQRHRPRVEHCL